jgi:hypothetical protein
MPRSAGQLANLQVRMPPLEDECDPRRRFRDHLVLARRGRSASRAAPRRRRCHQRLDDPRPELARRAGGETPGFRLARCGCRTAGATAQRIRELDPRNRGTIYMSAGPLIASHRYPAGRDGCRPDGRRLPQRRDQRPRPHRVEPATPCTSYARRRAHLLDPAPGGRPGQRAGRSAAEMRVLLDAPKLARLGDLPAHLSQPAGTGSASSTTASRCSAEGERPRRCSSARQIARCLLKAECHRRSSG